MLAGISTACFYPMLTEHALKRIADAGVAAAEVFFNAPSEYEDGFVRELRRIADGGGTRIASVHPFTSGLEPLLFFSGYERRYLDGIEMYKRFFHAANLLGAPLLVLHGDRRDDGNHRPYERYFELFDGLARAGRAMGVTVAQENVPRCASWQPAFFAAMHKALPDARFVLDTKQSVRAGIPIADMVRAMGSAIAHLHISDHAPENDCLPIGKGGLDLHALLCLLRENGFDGAVLLELYRDSYGEYSELTDSYHKILAAINVQNNE